MNQRLQEALGYFKTDDETASVLEHVVHARDGLITGNELLAKLEQDTGEKFGTDEDLGISLDPQHGSPLSKAQVPTERRGRTNAAPRGWDKIEA